MSTLISDTAATRVFKSHRDALLKELFPDGIVQNGIIEFTSAPYHGISCMVRTHSIYFDFDNAFIEMNPRFNSSFVTKFEVVKSNFDYRHRQSRAYLYPADRDFFDKSEAGMKSKANYMVLVVCVCLNYLASYRKELFDAR